MTVFFILLVVILLLVLFTNVKIQITCEKNAQNSKAEVYVKYLFIKKRLYPKEPQKKGGGGGKTLSDYQLGIKKILDVFNGVKDDIIKILDFASARLVKIQKLDLDIKFGLDDPMETGILTGAVNGAVYTILGVVHNHSYIEKCDINITPDFENVCHSVRFDCIIRMKNVHITVILIKILKVVKKIKKILSK